MNHASHSDFTRMGLAHYQPYQSAFDAVPPRGTECKPSTAPRKRGPKMSKAQQTAIALETANERKARHARQGKARALAQRVNFAMTHLDGGSSAMMDMESGKLTGWRDYMAEAMEMIPGVKVDREILATMSLPKAKRRKEQQRIVAARNAKGGGI